MRVYLVHWNQTEADARAAELTAAGHAVRAHWSSEQEYRWGDDLPDAVVISLDRLPSHGRAVAGWVWAAKKRRHIPIVFVGGAADKAQTTRDKFPDAVFCAWAEVVHALDRAVTRPGA